MEKDEHPTTGASLYMPTSVLVWDTEAAIECFACRKNVTTAFLTYCISDVYTHYLALCGTCSPRQGNYLRLHRTTEFEEFQKLCVDDARLEERATFFDYWNRHPKQLMHKISPLKTRKCNGCVNVGAAFFCARCQRAVYCSKACQTREWTAGHKDVCLAGQEIFHTRIASFNEKCEYTRYKSNLTIDYQEDAEVLCSKCNGSLGTITVDVCFFRGFSRRERVCTQCGTTYERDHTPELVHLVPFATTTEAFVRQLSTIKVAEDFVVWKVGE